LSSAVTHPRAFRAPRKQLAGVDVEVAARIISAAADIALIVDAEGVIQDVSVTSDELAAEGFERWIGRSWKETSTVESHPKIDAVLAPDEDAPAPRWRQMNHLSSNPAGRPIQWAVVNLGNGRWLAVGRDLAPLASLQQRLVAAQQSMEQDYIRLHQAQMRYRLLFQRSREPVMIVDAKNRRVIEANPTMQDLLGDTGEGIIGRDIKNAFDPDSGASIDALLAETTGEGTADVSDVRIAYTGRPCGVSASLFRDRSESFFLLRIDTYEAAAASTTQSTWQRQLEEVVEAMPDAFVLTDQEGTVLTANAAFLDLVQVVSHAQVVGEPLSRWLARESLDLQVMLTNLASHHSLRLFQTSLKGEFGARSDVEISAVAVSGERACAGFAIRNVSRRLEKETQAASASTSHLPTSVDQLKELVGHVPLKELVRDATDAIERMCIDAALELTNNNRASAAELLGLSRQSLYVKLHRYGLNESEQ